MKVSDERLCQLLESWHNGNRGYVIEEMRKADAVSLARFALQLSLESGVEEVCRFLDRIEG